MADGAHNELEDLGGLTTSIGKLNIENSSLPSARGDQNDLQDDGSDNFWFEDDLSNEIVDDGSSHASVLNREGRCRHNKNHTMGYRDGITAGKEASAQEGFNVGFRQSVHVGYRWGLVRGITSVLAGLSDSSKEKLVKKFEIRDRFLNLDKSVQAISANDALKMYNSILQNGSVHSHDHSEGDLQAASLTDEDSSSNKLENIYKDLISLLNDAPEINVNAIKT
ncbi:protein yae1-like [Phoenix dactylifera]|uniref:Protein yae1-like n=1 Tax=Phoenix dactylifera TaxID=42345 RepID=A0A8B7CJ48_PHODC|nr:protein yae1-like [Phoenix dactylifera]XP_026663297.2 protein yae1-like [Phoenix dactylifera]XP_026663298.2 protein yae1-like [Phoenix dactylifera]XP_026663299.2 protein yae1-like [Phoenix dactylifera]